MKGLFRDTPLFRHGPLLWFLNTVINPCITRTTIKRLVIIQVSIEGFYHKLNNLTLCNDVLEKRNEMRRQELYFDMTLC